MSVNLSPRQVASPGIAALVAAVLDETGLDPALLTLEITEGVLVTDSEATAQTLIDLKALGLRLVLDDFGTGYSSLAYLRRFPIDGLKIDRRFIAAMDTSTPDRTIVEAIIRMAAGLQIDVVAEGVETIEQAEGLVRLGCAHAQGYYYARPMPSTDVARAVRPRPAPRPRPVGAGRAAAAQDLIDARPARGRRQHAVERQRRLDHLLRERAVPQQLRPLVQAPADGQQDRHPGDAGRAGDGDEP